MNLNLAPVVRENKSVCCLKLPNKIKPGVDVYIKNGKGNKYTLLIR
jgi:hypothetical protein